MSTREGKTLSLRLDAELADALDLVATTEGSPLSEVIRKALREHVEKRRSDTEFIARMEDTVARQADVLRRLKKR